MHRFERAILATAALIAASGAYAQSPTPESRSDYIFRFATELSEFMLGSMEFKEQGPLDLGACSVNQQTNGPIVCARNCSQIAVCLLAFNGPAGLNATDVLEKAEEAPASGSGASSRVDAFNSAG